MSRNSLACLIHELYSDNNKQSIVHCSPNTPSSVDWIDDT